MIIISHNRVINWSNVLVARAYESSIKNGKTVIPIKTSRTGDTQVVFQSGHVTNLTIKYDDFEQQLRNAGKADIRVLQLDY